MSVHITLERSKEKMRGTHWRPVKHSVNERRIIKVLHREIKGDEPNVMRSQIQVNTFTRSDMLLAGIDQPYTQASIEDYYRRGNFVEGFVYVRALAAFLHEDVVGRYEKMSDQIGPGSIIPRLVEIDERAEVGAFVELERGVHLVGGTSIGDGSVVRKGAHLIGSKIAANSYVGQFVSTKTGFESGPSSIIERNVTAQHGVMLGMQDHIGQGTDIADGAFFGDSVRIGRDSYVGRYATIGEMTKTGTRLYVGDQSIVGAESWFGDFVRVARGLILASPTYAQSGEVITKSNLAFQLPPEF